MEKKKFWKYFQEISEVPRGSGYNEKISEYLVDFAKERNLRYHQDEELNVVIYKDASKGCEELPAIIIQGHMDMVCEKESGVEHDFQTEGLKLYEEDGYIMAEGTTLGGDDGIAMAYGLALLDSNDLVHPPLEILFTTDEEIGLIGATAFDASLLKGQYMINIDSEEEDILLTGCAGGLSGEGKVSLSFEKKEGQKIAVTIEGLTGGHSGVEIDKNRVNAAVLMGRLLKDLQKNYKEVTLISLESGKKDNAIPREAVLELLVTEEETFECMNQIKFLTEIYKNEYKANEPDLKIKAKACGVNEYKVMTEESKNRILFVLLTAPNGIQVMSPNIPGLVESSLNLGVLRMDDENVYFCYSVRSALRSYKDHISDVLRTIFLQINGEYSTYGEYPGWEYRSDSKLRDLYSSVYEKMHNKKMLVQTIHAGLECGIFSEKLPHLDIISIGPNIHSIHTVEEHMDMASAERVYDMLTDLLETFCK